mmetsp:Transcript_18999/g.54274  ORF Transcript_18999/g.54274 Transcript_18999/m.54274 type:complete len:225 (-) Transcript_18999:566-1240(-)
MLSPPGAWPGCAWLGAAATSPGRCRPQLTSPRRVRARAARRSPSARVRRDRRSLLLINMRRPTAASPPHQARPSRGAPVKPRALVGRPSRASCAPRPRPHLSRSAPHLTLSNPTSPSQMALSAPGPPSFLWPRRPWRCLARRRPAACPTTATPRPAASPRPPGPSQRAARAPRPPFPKSRRPRRWSGVRPPSPYLGRRGRTWLAAFHPAKLYLTYPSCAARRRP